MDWEEIRRFEVTTTFEVEATEKLLRGLAE